MPPNMNSNPIINPNPYNNTINSQTYDTRHPSNLSNPNNFVSNEFSELFEKFLYEKMEKLITGLSEKCSESVLSSIQPKLNQISESINITKEEINSIITKINHLSNRNQNSHEVMNDIIKSIDELNMMYKDSISITDKNVKKIYDKFERRLDKCKKKTYLKLESLINVGENFSNSNNKLLKQIKEREINLIGMKLSLESKINALDQEYQDNINNNININRTYENMMFSSYKSQVEELNKELLTLMNLANQYNINTYKTKTIISEQNRNYKSSVNDNLDNLTIDNIEINENYSNSLNKFNLEHQIESFSDNNLMELDIDETTKPNNLISNPNPCNTYVNPDIALEQGHIKEHVEEHKFIEEVAKTQKVEKTTKENDKKVTKDKDIKKDIKKETRKKNLFENFLF